MNEFNEGILIVDDEREMLELLADVVRDLNFPVYTSTNSIEALKIVENNKLFLILCDYRLETENGLTLYEKIKEINPLLDMILVTGYADKNVVIAALRLQVKDVIEKPFSVNDITAKVLSHAAMRKAAWQKEQEELALIKADFLTECETNLSDIDDLVLKIETSGTEEERSGTIDKIYRVIHTIKGNCGAVPDAMDLQKLAHALESLLSFYRATKIKPSDHIIDLVLSAVDSIKKLIQNISDPKSPPENITVILDELVSAKVELEEKKEDLLHSKSQEKVPNKAGTFTAKTSNHVDNEILVTNEKLDKLMETSGELLAFKNNFEGTISRLYEKIPEETSSLADLNKTLTEITDSLQTKILDVRKIKASRALATLPRIVRQLAKELQKDINVNINGGEIEVDKTIAHCLNLSLVHIVRNSCDHGIETIEERVKVGKPGRGNINIEINEFNEHIRVNITDDGHGLDKERILAKAITQNLINQSQASLLTEKEIYEFIFMPGFSTSKVVTDISGRGVGMDAVRSSVANLGGKVSIQTELGKCTQICLIIPKIKSVIIDKLFICSSENFLLALPTSQVEKIVKYDRQKELEINQNHIYTYEEKNIIVGSYLELINKRSLGLSTQENDSCNFVAIINHNEQKVGLKLSSLSNQIRSVIKPFDKQSGSYPGCKGIAVLPENKLALVIDSALLINTVKQQ